MTRAPGASLRGRLAAAGLAVAALTITTLAGLVMLELDREAELHRDVIAAQHVKGSLEALRVELNDLRHAARLAAMGRGADAMPIIERRAVEIDAELAYLRQQPARSDTGGTFDALADASGLLVVQARSATGARPAAFAPRETAAELERLGADATAALERLLAAQSSRINERTLAQLRIGETLRGYVAWLLAGSIVLLVGLAISYRRARVREAHAMQRIERLAHFDAVTGLPNRTLLIDRLEQEVARSRRGARVFAVLLFDLDGFKEVNDSWGHAAGDQVLSLVAARARACMRASDTVGRLGGDEFLAILPDTSAEGALQVAGKLLATLSVPYPVGEASAAISASIGVSVFPQHGAGGDALQSAADAALYAAKRAGKNRATVAAARQPAAAEDALA